jgi:hypothetical protein
MQDIKKQVNSSLGRHIRSPGRNITKSGRSIAPRPEYQAWPAQQPYPGWAGILFPPLGRSHSFPGMGCAPDQFSRSPLSWASIAKPGRLPPGRPGLSPSSGWAGAPLPGPFGRRPGGPAAAPCPGGPAASPRPGWAGLGGSGLAGILLQAAFANAGWAGLYCSGWARQGSLAQAGLSPW